MKDTKVSIQEVKDYYNGKYTKIIKALEEKVCTDYVIDKDCYGYLELSCVTKNGNYIKVNHGISNKYPYNCWYKKSYENIKVERFKTMNEVVEFIKDRY